MRKGKLGKWEQVYKLALGGFTNAQIADFLGLTTRTIEYWISNKKPGFYEALRAGKMEADMKIAEALYRKALGYRYKETLTITNKEDVVIRKEVVEKQQAPDTFACLKWLQIRQRENWTDVSKSEVNINYKGALDLNVVSEQLKDKEQFSDEEIALAAKLGLTQIAESAKN